MTDRTSLTPAYFDKVYEANADPWNFEGSAYERDKYARTMEALPPGRFESAFEIGCSIGVLTKLLADRCDRLLAADVSEVALTDARRRLTGRDNVVFRNMAVPQQYPSDRFDLVMLSEVGYYWSRPDLSHASRLMIDSLLPGASLLLVHWTPRVDDYPLTGDEVHEHFMAQAGPGKSLMHVRGFRADTYRLDLFERTRSPVSWR